MEHHRMMCDHIFQFGYFCFRAWNIHEGFFISLSLLSIYFTIVSYWFAFQNLRLLDMCQNCLCLYQIFIFLHWIRRYMNSFDASTYWHNHYCFLLQYLSTLILLTPLLVTFKKIFSKSANLSLMQKKKNISCLSGAIINSNRTKWT